MGKIILFVFTFLVVAVPQVAAQTDSMVKPPRGLGGTIKQEKSELRDARQAKRQEFKDRIAQIKDTRKKMIAERIDNNIATRNTRLTDKMEKALERLSNHLGKFEDRAAALKDAGKNTAAVESAIAAADAAITAAQSAVDAQSQKVYTATITDDSTLGSTISQMFQQFRQDIMATHATVKTAKEAVVKVLQELAKISGEKAATSSANF